jgi:hypothetical protein
MIARRLSTLITLASSLSWAGNASQALPCPQPAYLADPDITVVVAPEPDHARNLFVYTIRVDEQRAPLVNFRIKGMAKAEVRHWDGAIDECQVMNQRTLSCWMKARSPDHKGAVRTATVTVASPEAAGLGTYTAQSAVQPIWDASIYQTLLERFQGDKQLLTESVIDAIATQCSFADVITDDQRFISGAIAVPAGQSSTAPLHHVDNSEGTTRFVQLVDEASRADMTASLQLFDSAGRALITQDAKSKAASEDMKLQHQPTIDDAVAACNVKALIAKKNNGTAFAVALDNKEPCQPTSQTFDLKLP